MARHGIAGLTSASLARKSMAAIALEENLESTNAFKKESDIATPHSQSQQQTLLASEQPTPPPRKTYIQRMTLFGSFSDFTMQSYWQHMYRPFILFLRIPAVAFTAIEYSFILCWVAVLVTTQPILFAQPPYNFSSIGVGNINVAPFIGAIVGSAYGGPLNDLYVVSLARRRAGIYHPETRLHMLIAPMLLTPLGLFLYGISIAKVVPGIRSTKLKKLTICSHNHGSCHW